MICSQGCSVDSITSYMNILQVTASMDPVSGGVSQGIRNTIPELEKLGIHNEVVCLDAPGAPYLAKDGFIVHALGPSKGAWQSGSNLIPWLLANLSRFDTIIVNGLWLYHGMAVRKALKQYKQSRKGKDKQQKMPDLYIMPHGMLDPYFQKAKGRKIKAFRNWLYWKLIESKNVNEATGVLFTCESELLLARQTFQPYKPKKELNVGYGIAAPPAFDQSFSKAFLAKNAALNNCRYFLFLSRVHEKKGVDLVLQAYAEILRDVTIQKVEFLNGNNESGIKAFPKLVIAGPGIDTVYGDAMKKLVLGNQLLKDAVFFTGMLSGDIKWGAFYACEAFILPSHQENFGIAVVEALACGKPVLISNQVNIWREIDQDIAGFIEPDTLEGTRRLIDRFLSAGSLEKKNLRINALTCYKRNFTSKAAAEKLFAAIKN